MEVNKNTDTKGIEIIEKLTPKLLGPLPSTERDFIKFLDENLKLMKQLEPRISNAILRKALANRSKDTEQLIKQLRWGKGSLRDILEYNSKNIKELKEALEENGNNDI